MLLVSNCPASVFPATSGAAMVPRDVYYHLPLASGVGEGKETRTVTSEQAGWAAGELYVEKAKIPTPEGTLAEIPAVS